MKVAFPKNKLNWIKRNIEKIGERFDIKKPKVRTAKNNPNYIIVEESE